MKRKALIYFGLAALFGSLFLVPDVVNISIASADNVIVIGNKDVPDDVLAKGELKKMFIGKQKFWNNNIKVVLATLNKSHTHDTFLKKYIGKSSSQYRRYWVNRSFTGKGVAPKSFKLEEELVQFVSQTSGAIGYISSNTNINGAKVISIN